MNREKYVVLEITNWAGLSLGAEHYYGKLRKKDDWKWYKKGSLTSRFDDPDEIREIALEKWKVTFTNSNALLEGHSSSAEPMKVLWIKNKEYLDELNLIYNNFEKIERVSKNYKMMDNLGDSFFGLLENACE